MSDYTKLENYAAKDALVEGDPNKIIKGSELDAEFVAIQTAVTTKSDLLSPVFTGVPRAPTAAFGTNTTQLATTAFVQANGVPVGGILMWSGIVSTIPSGYKLCDGTNGTPDLRGKFIIGAGGSYSPSATGGSATLVLANLPSHTHTFTTDSGGAHSHNIVDGGHSHTLSPQYIPSGSGYGGAVGTGLGSPTSGPTGTSSANITISNSVSHTHAGTTAAAGSATPTDVLPPYFALAYIMRTA